jgi:hypothetical protein
LHFRCVERKFSVDVDSICPYKQLKANIYLSKTYDDDMAKWPYCQNIPI